MGFNQIAADGIVEDMALTGRDFESSYAQGTSPLKQMQHQTAVRRSSAGVHRVDPITQVSSQ